jgi:hypothetical protein
MPPSLTTPSVHDQPSTLLFSCPPLRDQQPSFTVTKIQYIPDGGAFQADAIDAFRKLPCETNPHASGTLHSKPDTLIGRLALIGECLRRGNLRTRDPAIRCCSFDSTTRQRRRPARRGRLVWPNACETLISVL